MWAPDDQQGFPSGFGADGKLFTADDPIVRLPAGYTVVNMDRTPSPLTGARPKIELIESEAVGAGRLLEAQLHRSVRQDGRDVS